MDCLVVVLGKQKGSISQMLIHIVIFLLCVGSRQLVFFKTCLHEVDKEDKGGIEEDKGG